MGSSGGAICITNLSAAEERRLGRVRLEEETRRLRGVAENELVVTLQESEKKLKATFAARETMIMEVNLCMCAHICMYIDMYDIFIYNIYMCIYIYIYIYICI